MLLALRVFLKKKISMKNITFTKSFTQQEPIPAESIRSAVNVLRSGRLHRYNTLDEEQSETALLEKEFSEWQGSKFCLATTSGGTAMQIALRAAGVKAGDKVLTNSFTLAPVPGAIHTLNAEPILIDSTKDLVLDLEDLQFRLKSSKAKFMLVSHMRGHLVNMRSLVKILKENGIILIEDCAHTMGAYWNNVRSGNFGSISCFSTQTYKHLNSGEGGFITTNDSGMMATCILLSGSYMLYEKHNSLPKKSFFEKKKFEVPNCSMRMDNLRASILRPQIKKIDANIQKWNDRHHIFTSTLGKLESIYIPQRSKEEKYVGSSFQFLVPSNWSEINCVEFLRRCKKRGVEIKWFGNLKPVGYTSRHESWKYIKVQNLPNIPKIVTRVMDIRIPLTFTLRDCRVISKIISEEVKKIKF